ncbi:MAG: uroporphyrinogen-III synthase [Bacteroidota bacterium]
MKTIFISRNLTQQSPFKKLKNQDIEIIDESLIEISQIRYSYTPQTKWIFFSSKNAITYFFAQNPQLPLAVKYAVISNSSAIHLLTFGITADFIGDGVDIVQIGKNFRDILKDDSVLFPQAIDSLQTIQKQIAFTNTSYNLYVYKTTIKSDFKIPHTDTVIFTSPSNVDAYFSKNKIDHKQLVLAMGSATKYKLAEYGVVNVLTPVSFDETALVNLLLTSYNQNIDFNLLLQ